MTTNNAQHVIITKNAARTAPVTDLDSLKVGDTIVTDEAGVVMTTASTLPGTNIKIVGRDPKGLLWSPTINPSNLKRYIGTAPVAAVEQLTNVGYDGVTAATAITALNSNDYLMRVIRYDNQSVFANKQMLKFGAFTSSAAATQQAVCEGLTTSLVANFVSEPEKVIKFEIINSATSAARTGTATTFTATNGSKVVAINGTVTNAGLIGGYIRFATAAAGGTGKVYKITAYTASSTITLDRAFEGTSAVVAHGNVSVMTNAVAAAGNWGIVMTGLPMKFERGVFKYGKSRFEVTLSGFGATSLAFTTAASEGTGTYEAVAEMEWFSSQGVHGLIERIGTPPPVIAQNTVSTSTGYGMVYLEAEDTQGGGTIQGNKPSPFQVYVCYDKTSGYGTGITGVISSTQDVINAWAVANGFATQTV